MCFACPSPITWKNVDGTAQIPRCPVGTKLNNSQNADAESALPGTLATSMLAQLSAVQLLRNTPGVLRRRHIACEGSNRLGLRT